MENYAHHILIYILTVMKLYIDDEKIFIYIIHNVRDAKTMHALSNCAPK